MSPASNARGGAEKIVGSEILVEHVTADSIGLADSVEVSSEASNVLSHSATRAELETRLVRKVDMRLLPMVVIIYIINYIDVSIRDFYA